MQNTPLLQTFFARYLPPLEKEMRTVVKAARPHHAELVGMLRYHMGWVDAEFNPCQTRSGKRVRPILCLLACEACGGDWEQALPAGAAVELMHNFTLIHDDLEDGDQTRRGRPTVWAVWGVAQGTNAGDALFALTHLALLRLSERGVSDATILEAFRLLNHTCLVLTVGQQMDIGFESREDVSIEDYLTMVEEKTAALAACACEMGALVAGTPDDRRERLRSFGRNLGLSFQMRDDILGIWGDPAVTGKPAGADIIRRKKSLPILHSLEQNAELRALLTQGALSETNVGRAMELLEETHSREYTEQLACEYHAQALAALEEADLESPAAQALHDLAQVLLDREQ